MLSHDPWPTLFTALGIQLAYFSLRSLLVSALLRYSSTRRCQILSQVPPAFFAASLCWKTARWLCHPLESAQTSKTATASALVFQLEAFHRLRGKASCFCHRLVSSARRLKARLVVRRYPFGHATTTMPPFPHRLCSHTQATSKMTRHSICAFPSKRLSMCQPFPVCRRISDGSPSDRSCLI